MSSSFANASNFVISNSTFTHIAGSQHNYNFSGRPSTARCEAMARFVLAVNDFKPAEEKTPFHHQSEIYIHEFGRSMGFPGPAYRPDIQNVREATYPPQSVTEHSRVPPGIPQHITNTRNCPLAAPQSRNKELIESGLPPHLTNENVVHKEHEDPTEQPTHAEDESSYEDRSSPLPSSEAKAVSRASSVVSYTPTSPAPASLRPPLPPGPVSPARQSCHDANSGATLAQPRLSPLYNHPVPHQSTYGPLMSNTDPSFRPSYVGDVNGPRVSDDIMQPFWFGKNETMQSPLPQQSRHSDPQYISHPTLPHQAYRSCPPLIPYALNADPQDQHHRESYNMLCYDSHYSGYPRNDYSEFQQTHPNAPVQSYAPAYHQAPASPYAHNHHVVVRGGVLPPFGGGGIHGVPDAFAAHPYYNAY